MKYTALDGFNNHLAKQAAYELPHAYLIASADSYEQKKIADAITAKALHHAPSTEIIRLTLDGDLAPISGEVQNPSLFAPEKMIVVDGLELLGKGEFEQLEVLIKGLPKSVRLVLLTKDLKSAPKFYEHLKTDLVMLDLRGEKPWERTRRIEASMLMQVKQAGKRLDADAMRELIDRNTADLSALSGQVEKLICYVGDATRIDRAAVDAFLFENLPFDGWKLTDAILFKKGSRSALSKITEVSELFAFFGQLRHRIYTSLQILSGDKVPSLKPQMIEKIRPNVVRFGPKYYEIVLSHLFDLELKMRQDRFNPQDLVTGLLARVDEAAENYTSPQLARA